MMNTPNTKGLRELVYQKLEEIRFFYPTIFNTLTISEPTPKSPIIGAQAQLNKLTIQNIPTEKIWVFDNEFNENIDKTFVSAGEKVEKTILWVSNLERKLYILMFEMKRTMDCGNLKKVLSKIENALSHLSIFIASHPYLSDLEIPIEPVAICAYNQINALRYSDEEHKVFQDKYKAEIIQNKGNCILGYAEPLIFGSIQLPFLFYQNPNDPLTDNFEINFQDILTQINSTYT
jgi:hypothetical protein